MIFNIKNVSIKCIDKCFDKCHNKRMNKCIYVGGILWKIEKMNN